MLLGTQKTALRHVVRVFFSQPSCSMCCAEHRASGGDIYSGRRLQLRVLVPWLAMSLVPQRELRTIKYYRDLDTAQLVSVEGKKNFSSYGRAERPVATFLRGLKLSHEQVRMNIESACWLHKCRGWCAGEDALARLGCLVRTVARCTSS